MDPEPSAGALPQQVMSAQSVEGPRLSGESDGPNYGTMPVQPEPPARVSESVQMNGYPPPSSSGMPNTATAGEVRATASTLEGNSSRTLQDPPLLPGVAGRQQTLDGVVEARARPGGTEAHVGVSPATGQASFAVRQDHHDAAVLAPSPLPSTSPATGDVARMGSVTARAATWMSRIGDLFQQRRVEVHTSWSPANHGRNPWVDQPPFVAIPPSGEHGASRDAERSQPSSSGSAPVPYELVQAEVSKQLEGALGSMMARLEAERMKAEEAEQQAEMLRSQLEVMELQAQAMARGEYGAPEPRLEPGLRGAVGPTVQELLHPVDTQLPQRVPPEPPGLVVGTSMSRPKGTPWSLPTPAPIMNQSIENAIPVPPKQPHPEPQGVDPSTRPAETAGRGRRFLQGLLGLGVGGNSERTSGPIPMPSASAPPPAGLGHLPPVASTNLAGSEQVLTAMARGIESLLMNQSNKGDRPETVKPGITELPSLPSYTPESGSIDLINWVTHITPIMEDLSDSSSLWWTETLQDVMTWYTRYSTSTPLERVQLLPVRSSTAKPEWARVERRATAMMLTAIPANLKEEVIATGGVTTVNLLAKLFSTYQPGNRQEKALVLANLEKPAECTDAKGAVEALRKWALWRRRAMAIGITEPDATVLLQGLDRICGSVVRADSELAFRVSLIRSTLQVDTCPNAESVTRLFQHLQAELEQQARLGVVRGTENQPKLKALGTAGESIATPTTTPSTTTPTRPAAGQCKFFISERGCRRGKECRYPHTWSAFEKAERAKRCLVCGGTGHKSKECKAPGGGAQAKPKDGPQQQHPKDSGATPSSAPSSGSSSPTRRVGFDSAPEVVMKVLSVLEEVKRVKAFAPLVEAVDRWSQRWASPTPGKTALMDSGATHPLRQPRDEQEWREAMDVRVALAGDAKATMKQTVAGTLLSGDVLSQVIVPLGRVINSLGYQLRWTANECALLRGDHEVIPLRVVRGCPEVDEHVAQQLIRELEQTQIPRLQDATMDSVRILRDVEVSWWSCLIEYVATGDVQAGKEALRRSMFFSEEDREELSSLLFRYPNDGGWSSMKDAGLNRRTRKRLMRASTWIVRWDPPGFTRPSDVLQKVGRMTEVAYLNVGSISALGGPMAAWKVLLWAATQGRIGAVLTKDLAATPAELQAHHLHRAKVHFLHALSAAGMYYKGSAMPRLLVERRRGAAWDSLDWMCDGRSQRYVDEMGLSDPMFDESKAIETACGITGALAAEGGGRLRVARMSQDAAWRLHVMRNHQPFRRDCALCVRNAATGKQHRATLHPTGYTLSIDVAGPLRGAGKSPDGKFFKYFLVGAFRIPLLDGGVTYDDELRGHPIPEDPELDEAPVLSDDDQVDAHLEEEEAVGPIAEERRDQEEWERLKAKFKAPLMTETLYFCVPMNSKKSLHILPALQQMVIDIRGLGYPVTRVHSDRGGELRSNAIKRWVLNQGIMRTTSTGSEPAENGVAEAGVRFLKRRGRVLLDAAGLGREHWPTAVQSAALQQRCDKLGLVNPMPVAYGAKVYVKTKKYKTGDVESMKPHWIQGKYLGPSTDVRGGHVILKPGGTFLTTTHVRVAREPPSLDDVAPTIVVDPEEPPLPPPVSPPEAEEPFEHPGDRPRVEASSSSGLGRGRSLGPKGVLPVEHPGDRHRVEASSPSGLGPLLDDGVESVPPYPKGPPISYSPPMARVRGKSPGVRISALRAGDYEDMVEAMAEGEDQDGDQSYSQEEIMMKVLKAQEKQAVEAVAKELLSAGDFSKDACQRLLRALGGFHTRWKTPRTTTGQGMVLGAFVRGGSFGVTSHGKNLPNTMRFLNKFLMIRLQYTMPGSTCTWTTLALQRANQIPAHRDVHNQRGTRNYVMEIADESLEGLWIEGDASQHPVEGGDGLWCDHEYQTEDGQVLRGRVLSLDEPVAFDPRSRHAMVNEPGMKWVLSAYAPAGVHSLLQADVDYLFSQGFPVTGTGVILPSVRAIQRVSYGPHTTWETTPMESSSSRGPEFVPWSGSRGAWDQEEVDASVAGDEELDDDEAQGDWELYVEESEESSCVMEPSDEPEDEPIPRLRVLCSASDPGGELDLLSQRYESYLGEEEGIPAIQEDMARSLEDWETLQPRLAKVEPEFTNNIEELIAGLQEPLRHTHTHTQCQSSGGSRLYGKVAGSHCQGAGRCREGLLQDYS